LIKSEKPQVAGMAWSNRIKAVVSRHGLGLVFHQPALLDLNYLLPPSWQSRS
jgi:hypothetical protein